MEGGVKSRKEAQLTEVSEDKLTFRYRVNIVTALKKNFDLFWLMKNALRMNARGRDLFEKHQNRIDGIAVSKVVRPPTYYICPEDYHLLDQDLDELLNNLS